MIYERDICREVEREFDRAFLVVDVTTGAYSLGQSDEAFDSAEADNPDGLFYLMRVGRPGRPPYRRRSCPVV